MKTSRCDFLRFSAIAGTGIFLRPFNAFGLASEAGKFLEKIGISTGIANSAILASAGYFFVEENVRGFLVPSEPESVFEQKLALLKENESPSNITKYGHLLYHTHIAEKNGRTAPGVNNDDFTPYFKALKDVKYEGRMAIECSWKNLGEQAANSLQVMRNQLATV